MYVVFCFKTRFLYIYSPSCPGTHSIDQTVLKLQRSANLCLLNAGIKCVYHHLYVAFLKCFLGLGIEQ